MIKLKKLLKEGYAWERKANKPLPTLEDVQNEYKKKKMKEVLKDKDGNPRTDLKYSKEPGPDGVVRGADGKPLSDADHAYGFKKYGKPTSKVQSVKLDDINPGSIEFEGIKHWDHPDYVDAYMSYAEYNDGESLTDDEMEWLADNEQDFVYDALMNYTQ